MNQFSLQDAQNVNQSIINERIIDNFKKRLEQLNAKVTESMNQKVELHQQIAELDKNKK